MERDDEIFARILDASPAERPAMLEQACGDDAAQRARIEALLAAHDHAGDFLEGSVSGRPEPLPDEQPGDTIGRYTLIRKIGEGGCGTVYLAEQKEPVRRRVALKIIKLGMDTRQVIARFEGERQALAMMDHPDIARVFDAGATEAGRPFFVMEFVNGVPVTRFCDEHSLPVPARLELFARVCLALQHAHQKGIIHRDIKPSNILVALHDGVPTPKVIDFGIAKATQERLTDQTLVTRVDQFIGTPSYMSPEQADLRDFDIDTRSDVYSLGVLLYELLTSRLPFDPKTLGQAGVAEIRRIIREVDPPRPAQRVATLVDADRATAARLRRVAPAQLSATLRGDLDWIVMRCLEKDRDRRYSTARELADDVRRHLRHDPVEARPPTTAYRVERFVARHRLACASAAAIALTLIVATVVSVRQAVIARRAERAETLARTDAQRRQEEAEDLLTFMLGDFRTELKKIGRLQLLDTVGEKAMAYFASLNPRDLTDTALARQAKALTQIGEIRLDEARYAEASAAFTTAYHRAAALAARHPHDGDMLFERAQAEYWIGFAARRRGDFPAEHEWLTRYRDSAVALVAIEGKTPRAQGELSYGHHNLAVLDVDQGNLTAAKQGFLAEKSAMEELLRLNPTDSGLRSRLAEASSWLGSIAERDGNYAEALARFGEMSAGYEELVRREPTVARWQLRLAESLTFGGVTRDLMGRRAEASAAFARSQTLHDQLVALDPKNRQWQLYLQNLRLEQAVRLIADGDTAAAASIVGQTRGRLEALVQAEPSSKYFTRCLGSAWRVEAFLRLAAGRTDKAEAAIRQAIDLDQTLMEKTRTDTRVLAEMAQAHLLAGRIALARGSPERAQEHWQHALAALPPGAAQTNDWRVLDPAAQALVLLGKPAEARPLIERLQRFGYHPLDPLAAPLLAAASLPGSATKNP